MFKVHRVYAKSKTGAQLVMMFAGKGMSVSGLVV
jgi:hypothetical protein